MGNLREKALDQVLDILGDIQTYNIYSSVSDLISESKEQISPELKASILRVISETSNKFINSNITHAQQWVKAIKEDSK